MYNDAIPGSSAEDLSAGQYHAVDIDGTYAQAVTTAIGILQNYPVSGRDMTIVYSGRSRYFAGAAVAAGARITVTTSGWFITANSGDAYIGRAIGAVSSGGIGEGIFDFAHAGYANA